MWSYWCEHQENINYAWHMPVCVCESLSCVRLSMAPRIVAHPTRILQWIAIPICRGSSQPRDGTQVSNIAGGCFIIWATREIQHVPISRLSISIQAKFYIDNTFCLIHGIIMSYHGPPTLLLQTSDYIFTFDLIFNVWRCFIWGGEGYSMFTFTWASLPMGMHSLLQKYKNSQTANKQPRQRAP